MRKITLEDQLTALWWKMDMITLTEAKEKFGIANNNMAYRILARAMRESDRAERKKSEDGE